MSTNDDTWTDPTCAAVICGNPRYCDACDGSGDSPSGDGACRRCEGAGGVEPDHCCVCGRVGDCACPTGTETNQ